MNVVCSLSNPRSTQRSNKKHNCFGKIRYLQNNNHPFLSSYLPHPYCVTKQGFYFCWADVSWVNADYYCFRTKGVYNADFVFSCTFPVEDYAEVFC